MFLPAAHVDQHNLSVAELPRQLKRSGLAWFDGARFTADPDGPLLRSPHRAGGLRYADAVVLPDGAVRWFYEATRPDGAHELRTVLLTP